MSYRAILRKAKLCGSLFLFLRIVGSDARVSRLTKLVGGERVSSHPAPWSEITKCRPRIAGASWAGQSRMRSPRWENRLSLDRSFQGRFSIEVSNPAQIRDTMCYSQKPIGEIAEGKAQSEIWLFYSQQPNYLETVEVLRTTQRINNQANK